jgi:hypothetical protein
MKPDTYLGENARQIEVSDDQITLMRDARQFAAAWNSAKMVNDSTMRMQPTKIEVDVN